MAGELSTTAKPANAVPADGPASAFAKAAGDTPADKRAGRYVRIDNRFLPPLLITSILLTAHLSFGILEGWERTALAIVTAIGAELLLGRITYGAWPHPASSYISGISAGILVRSPFLWPYFFASFISIVSKYVLRVNGRHLWNPTNFGVSVMAFIAPATVTVLSIQWGNNLAPMAVIWLLGSVIVWRVGRAHISAAYVASFLLFSVVRTLITGTPFLANVAPITGPMYQLFIFFMVTDPKTTVRSTRGQVAVVIAVAFVEMLLRLADVLYAPFYALFLVGPVALLVEDRLSAGKRDAVATRPKPATT
jgi:enediyne biosynthesis protein E5